MHTIGILTGGGDVPGLNTVIRDLTFRVSRMPGYRIIGIKRGWGGLVYMDPKKKIMDPEHVIELTEDLVRPIDRDGGTFLHSSRVKPTNITKNPNLLKYRGFEFSEPHDMTSDVLTNISNLGVDTLVAIGGDDTLSYANFLSSRGIKVIGVPKTMDGDIYGTDYCLGFSTAISKANDYITQLRTTMGSHERLGIIEIAGRDSGFTALNTAMAAKPDRVIIPEVKFDVDRLLSLLLEDKQKNPSNYAFALIAEGAKLSDGREIYERDIVDDYGHKKLGGIGKYVSDYMAHKTNMSVMSESLGYFLRSGNPDAKDKIVASVFANVVFNEILKGNSGVMCSMKEGKYTTAPLTEVSKSPKKVDVQRFYKIDRYHPLYENFESTEILL